MVMDLIEEGLCTEMHPLALSMKGRGVFSLLNSLEKFD